MSNYWLIAFYSFILAIPTSRDCIKLVKNVLSHIFSYTIVANIYIVCCREQIDEYIKSRRNFVSVITWHNDPHPSSRISFNDKMSVSSFPFGCSERTSASCLIPSQPILLFVRSKDLILLFPPSNFTMASILSSVRLLFANTSFSANGKNGNV